jgi:predicted DNA-binding transcriptional regulator AlpA
MQDKPKRYVRWPGLRRIFDDNISRSTIDRWEERFGFPKRIKIGPNSVAWDLSSVEQWLQERANNG